MEKNKRNIDWLNKKIEIRYEKQIKALVIAYLCFYVLHYLYDILERIPTIWMTRFVNLGLIPVVTVPMLVSACVWGVYKEKEPKPGFKNYRQYIYAILLLIACFGIANLFMGGGVFPEKITIFDRAPLDLIWYFVHYGAVGVQEEWVFRCYIQGELSMIFGRFRWLAPFVAALLFVAVHIPQRGTSTLIVVFFIGLIMGYAKFFFKDCTYISVVIAHWMYDFLLIML